MKSMISAKQCLIALLANAALAVSLAASRVEACAAFGELSATRVEVVNESAVIVWDQERKVQHFIRRATFDTASRDIGFLVPTPSVPELAAASDKAFTQLERVMEPEVIHRQRRYVDFRPLLLGRRISNTFSALSNSLAGTTKSVEVLHSQRVAGYDAVVLAADDVPDLNRWLKKHGYVSSPALMAWLAPYVAARWKITAFKIAKADSGSTQVSSSAVRMSFATPQPFFPYREPQSQSSRKNTGYRLLRVFMIGTHRMAGKVGAFSGTPLWPGRVAWTDNLASRKVSGLARNLALTDDQLPKSAWLTVFEDSSSPRRGKHDVFFLPSKDQSRIVPPPVIITHDVRIRLPLDLLVVALLLCGWGGTRFLDSRRTEQTARA